MKNKLFITALSFFLLFLASNVFATSGVNIIFETDPDPLFYDTDIKPGHTVTKWVKVENNSGESQPIATEAINWPGFSNSSSIPSDDLSRALDIVIRFKGGSDIFTGTLYDFYINGETHLSDVADSTVEEYEFEVGFPWDKGNEWQEKITSFDIIVGVEGQEGENGNGDDDGSSRGGGGGGGLPPGLTIRGESELLIDCCGTNPSATISWNTNYKATSQVIYSTLPNQFDLSEGPSYYGYDYYVEGDDRGSDKYLNHDVTLTGLTEGITYYYRCVSHASPATIGKEHSFTIICSETDTGDETGANGYEEEGEQGNSGGGIIGYLPTTPELGPGPSPSPSPSSISTAEGESPTGENLIEEGIAQEESPSFLAAVGDLFGGFINKCFNCLPWWLLLILAAFCALMGVLRYKKKAKQSLKWFILAVLLVFIAFIVWFIFGYCVSIWILILITLLTFAVWRLLIYEKKRNSFQFEQQKKVNFLKDKVFIFGLIIFLILFILLAILGCLYIWIIIAAILIYLLGVSIIFKKQNLKKRPL